MNKCTNKPMPNVAYASEVRYIRAVGHLNDQEIALATGASARTVNAWRHDERTPGGDRAARLLELSAIVERLAKVVPGDYIPIWLSKPIAALDGRKPIDMLAAGEYQRVGTVIADMEAPTVT